MTEEALPASATRAPDYYAYVRILLQIIEVTTDAGQNLLVSSEVETEVLLLLLKRIPGVPPDLLTDLTAQAEALREWHLDRSAGRDARKVVLACHRMASTIGDRALGRTRY